MLMLHFVRGFMKARGNRVMHLGGGLGGAHDSLFDFKAGFSKDRQPFRTWRVVVDPVRYAELSRARHPPPIQPARAASSRSIAASEARAATAVETVPAGRYGRTAASPGKRSGMPVPWR